jgi:hypothetical protein
MMIGSDRNFLPGDLVLVDPHEPRPDDRFAPPLCAERSTEFSLVVSRITVNCYLLLSQNGILESWQDYCLTKVITRRRNKRP